MSNLHVRCVHNLINNLSKLYPFNAEKLKLLINATAATGFNTGRQGIIKCINFLPSTASEITLVLSNGDIITPRTTGPISPMINGLIAEFDVVLAASSQEFTCVVQTPTERVNKTAVVRAFGMCVRWSLARSI